MLRESQDHNAQLQAQSGFERLRIQSRQAVRRPGGMRGGMRPAQPDTSPPPASALAGTLLIGAQAEEAPHGPAGQPCPMARPTASEPARLPGPYIPAASPPRSAQPGSTQAGPARLGQALRAQWSRFPTTPFPFSLSSHVLPGKHAAGISVHRRGAALGMPHCSPFLRHGRPGSGAVRVGFRTRGQGAQACRWQRKVVRG
jgi:hypothetical protein